MLVTPWLWIYGGCLRIREFGKRIDALAHYEELKEALERWSNRRRQAPSREMKALGAGGIKYAPDGTWIRIAKVVVPHIAIHDVTAKTHLPDLLKLSREKLKLLQLGWKASDEYNDKGRPAMGIAQPWQVFAWAAVRYGELRIHITSVNLTREGVSVLIRIIARSWRQKWSKDEAIDLVASHLRRGEWAPC